MDAFKRATLLTTQAAMGQITSDEVRSEMATLIPAMQADPESQKPQVNPLHDKPPQTAPTQKHEEPKHAQRS